jgi:UDP-N-acetylglucosamine 2-epimerase
VIIGVVCSGDVHEEIPALGKLVLLVMREMTEWGSSTFNRGRLKKTGTLAQSGYENNQPETHEPTGSMLPK